MTRTRYRDVCSDNIQFVLATMPPSDNAQHLDELVRFVTSILLCIHNSPLSPDFAAAQCARSMIFRERGMTAKTRRVLTTIADAKRPEKVVKDLIISINTIETDYGAKIASGLITAA